MLHFLAVLRDFGRLRVPTRRVGLRRVRDCRFVRLVRGLARRVGCARDLRRVRMVQSHARHDWYPGVAGSLFSMHLWRRQNERLRDGLCFLIVIFGSPYRTQCILPSRPRTIFALFLLGPGVHVRVSGILSSPGKKIQRAF